MDPQNPFSNTPTVTTSQPVFPPLQPIIRAESKINIKPLIIVLITALVIFGVVFLPRQIIKTTSITVSGTGKVSTVPQSVSLIVTRTNAATDPSMAIDAGESGLIALINEAKSIVGTDAEVQKSFYTTSLISAQQSVNGQATVVKGLQVANGFKISFKDVSKTNELIKTLYAKGASAISNVSFVPVEKDQIENDARKLAMANAKINAEKIANTMGKRVGRIVSFADDQADAASTISSSQGSFGTESIDITKTVSVIYEIW